MDNFSVIDRLQLMYNYADQEDLKCALEAGIGAVKFIDKVTDMALDPSVSDEQIGITIRQATLAAMLEAKHARKNYEDEGNEN